MHFTVLTCENGFCVKHPFYTRTCLKTDEKAGLNPPQRGGGFFTSIQVRKLEIHV